MHRYLSEMLHMVQSASGLTLYQLQTSGIHGCNEMIDIQTYSV